MACSQTISGLVRDCEPNAGGIKKIYIANRDDVTAVALAASGGKIGTITMASSAKFKGFWFRKGQASFTLTPQFNEAGEYVGEQGVIAVNFGRMDTTKRAQMHAVSLGELCIIVEDQNGLFWFFGYDNGVTRTGGESGTGAARTDSNHYGLELTSDDNQLPFEVDPSIIEDIVA